jgi:CarD family transcriptional regulator
MSSPAKATAAKPAPATSSSPAKAPPAKASAPKPPAPKAAASKPAAPAPAKPAETKAAPARKPAAAQPAAVAASSLRSVAPTPPPAPPATAAAPAPAPKPAAKPQIETSQIVTASANDANASRPAAAEAPAARPAEAPRPAMHGGRPTVSRASNKDESFAEGDYVVYPTHGVGKVEKIAKEEIAGHHLELIHITFEENRMTLRVPVSKARSAGLRKLATRKMFDEALAVLKGRARVKRTMWSRRAQEYEAKINSGDPAAIAEVVRDLHRNAGQPDQSFSERQIYEAAMDRLAAELAALDQTDKPTALTKLGNFLKTL